MNRISNLLNFDRDPSNTSSMNISLTERSTTSDLYSSNVVLNVITKGDDGSYFLRDEAGQTLRTENILPVITSEVTRNSKSVLKFTGTESVYAVSPYDFNFESEDFTIEMWIRFNTLGTNVHLIGKRTSTNMGPWLLMKSTTGFMGFYTMNSSATAWEISLIGTTTIVANKWYHVAVCRDKRNLILFVDGKIDAITRVSTLFRIYSNSELVRIGASAGMQPLNGYMDDIRVTRGVARYSRVFTPPQSIPSLSQLSLRITDDVIGDSLSVNGNYISCRQNEGPLGNSCMYFDGSSYLSFPYNKSNDILDGSNPFTLDLWFKILGDASLDGNNTRLMTLIEFSVVSSGTDSQSLAIYIEGNLNYTGDGILIEYRNPTDTNLQRYPCKIQKNKWIHLLVVRESSFSEIQVYIDGKLINVVSDVLSYKSRLFSSSYSGKIGSFGYAGYNRNFKGYISDLRINRKDVFLNEMDVPQIQTSLDDALYHETKLLMHMNNILKDPSNGMLNDWNGKSLTMTGNVFLSGEGPFNNLCGYWDGSGGDRITIPYTSDMNISTGDFTIEFWFKPLKSSIQQIIDWRSSYTTRGINIFQDSSYKMNFYAGDSDTASWNITLTSSTIMDRGVWYFISIVKSMSTYALFIDGSLETRADYSGVLDISSADIWLGISRDGTSYPLNACIDDFRVTKYARYSIPQTTLIQNLSQSQQTLLLLNFNNTLQDSSVHSIPVSVISSVVLSSTQSKFGGYSAYFNGSNSYLSVNSIPALNAPLNSFSVDFWFFSELSSNYGLVGTRTTNIFSQFNIRVTTGSKLNAILGSVSTWYTITGTTTINANQWYYVTLIREGNAIILLLNGTIESIISIGATTQLASVSGIQIGKDYDYAQSFKGYIDDFRYKTNLLSTPIDFTVPVYEFDDSDASNALLMHFNGANGSTTFTDVKGNSVTPNGGAIISTAQSKFGGSSLYLNGVSQYLSVTGTTIVPSTASEPFSVECWVYLLDTPSGSALVTEVFTGSGNVAYSLGFCNGTPGSTSGAIPFFGAYSSSWTAAVSNEVLSLNQWHHVAGVSTGKHLLLYINGILKGGVLGTLTSENNGVYIGRRWDTDSPAPYIKGYIDDLRITKGVARYPSQINQTTQYSVEDSYWSNTSLMLTFTRFDASTDIVDSKSHQYTKTGNPLISTSQSVYGGSSLFFNIGDYLTFNPSIDFVFGTGDFTIEFWILTTLANSVIIDKQPWLVRVQESGKIGVVSNSALLSESNKSVVDNTWHHVAIVRNTQALKIYVDGFSNTSVIDSSDYSEMSALCIGSQITPYSYESSFLGYLDSVRITKGIARYTSDFSVGYLNPVSQLPVGFIDNQWSNVCSLLLFDEMNQFTDEKKHIFTPVGSVETSLTQSKFGGYSARFHGRGYLKTPHTDEFYFSGDFTIEFWIYPESVSVGGSGQFIINKGDGYLTSYASWKVVLINNEIHYISYSNNTGTILCDFNIGTVDVNQWYHIALSRYGNTFKAFINGTQSYTNTLSLSPFNNTTNGLSIGGDWIGYSARGFIGYLDEIRLTNGYSRYQNDFTTQLSAFVDQGSNSISSLYPGLSMRMLSNGSLTNIVDDKGHSVSVSGNTTLSSAQSKFGGMSCYLDGTGDSINIDTSIDLNLGTGDFTIEFWLFIDGDLQNSYSCIIGSGQAAYQNGCRYVMIGSTRVLRLGGNMNNVTVDILTSPTPLDSGQWYHIAITRGGNIFRAFLNGSISVTNTSTESIDFSNTKTYIGTNGWNGANGYLKAYIDDFQVIKGFAKYTKEFTVPNQITPGFYEDFQYLQASLYAPLTGDKSNSSVFSDLSLSQLSLIPTSMTYSNTVSKFPRYGTSAYFNGTTSKLSFSMSSVFSKMYSFNFQEDWTIECWVNPGGAGTNRAILTVDSLVSTHIGHMLYLTTSNVAAISLAKSSSNTTAMTLTGTINIPVNVWTHIRVVKSGYSVQLLINGSLDTTLLLTELPASQVALRTSYIGCQYGTQYWFNGHIQDLKFYRTNKSTETQIPHLMSMPSMKNMVLNYGFDSTEEYNTFGSATLSTAQSKFGGSSLYLNGITDYIEPQNISQFNHFDRPFTIEFWLMCTESTGNEQQVFKQVDSSGREISIKFTNQTLGDKLYVCVGDPNTDYLLTSLTKSDFNVFKHVQLKKKYRSFSILVDGVKAGTRDIKLNTVSRTIDSLHLHFNGTNGSTAIINSAINSASVTSTNAAIISTAQSKFGGSSLYLNGANYLSVASSNTLTFGTGDFTIEMWVQITADSTIDGAGLRTAGLLANYSTNGFALFLNGSSSTTGTGLVLVERAGSKEIFNASFSQSLSKNTWYHIALTRDSGYRIRGFLNGELIGESESGITVGNVASTGTIGITNTSGSYIRYLIGYIDELRVTKDSRYLRSFTPPTSEFNDSSESSAFKQTQLVRIGGGLKGYIDDFTVHHGDGEVRRIQVPTQRLQKESLIVSDLATDTSVWTNSGVYTTKSIVNSIPPMKKDINYTVGRFDGTGYLTYRRDYANWITGDFTIEFWFYKTDSSSVKTLISTRSSGSGYTSLVLQLTTTNIILYTSSNNSAWTQVDAGTISENTWYHCAITREGSLIRLFLNGVLKGSVDLQSFAQSLNNTLYIGGESTTTTFVGYMKKLLIINGYAKFTKSFIPDSIIDINQYYAIDYRILWEKRYFSDIMSYYDMNDTGTVLTDKESGKNLTITGDVSSQPSLIPFNDGLNSSLLFNGGKASGNTYSFSEKKSLSISFFIKTAQSDGEIIKKSSTFVIELANGKIRAIVYTTGDIYTVYSNQLVNDNQTHRVLIEFVSQKLTVYIDGVVDNSYQIPLSLKYNYVQEDFNGNLPNLMLQMRFNKTTQDDSGNTVLLFGSNPIYLSDSPVNSVASIFFDGAFHLEIPGVTFAPHQKMSTQMYPSSIDFTMTCWIKLLAYNSNNQYIISIGCPNSSTGVIAYRCGLAIYVNSTGKLCLIAGSTAYSIVFNKSTVNSIPLNTWAYISVVVKDHLVDFYINDVRQDQSFVNFATYPSNSLVNMPIYTTDNLNIGGNGWNYGSSSQGISTPLNTKDMILDDLRITRG